MSTPHTPPPSGGRPTRADGSFVGAGSIEDAFETAEAPPSPGSGTDSDLARLEDRVETAEVPRPKASAPTQLLGVDPDAETADGSADGTAPYGGVLPLPGQELTPDTVPPPEAPGSETEPFPTVLPVPGAKVPARLEPGALVSGVRLGKRLRNVPLGTVHAADHPLVGPCEVLVLSKAAAKACGPAFLLDARLRTTLDPDDPRLPFALALGGDLAPDDVRVAGERVRLTGFGRAPVLDAQGVRRPFPEGPSSGDAAYMAPEVAAGERPTAAADVYAVGAILWTGLTGHPPYTGTPVEIRTAILAGPPSEPETVEAGALAEALLAIARRCLARQPQDRFRDASALASALAAALGQQVGAARRRRVLLALAFVAALSLLAALAAVALAGAK